MTNKKPFNSLIDSEEIYHKEAEPMWPYYLTLVVIVIAIGIIVNELIF